MPKPYRVEKPEEFEKLYAWLDKADFDDLSRKCGARIWSRRFVQQLLGQKDYLKHEFNIFALEDDRGEILAILTAEVRFPERDKIPYKIAVNASMIFKRGCGQNEYNELVKYACRWAYEHGIYVADFWTFDTIASWQQQLLGSYSRIVAEADLPNIGRCVRTIQDFKGFVESGAV
jgi:hypothetical protein